MVKHKLNFLNIQEQLKGNWKNILFITYTADFSFFERTLLKKFYNICRNITVLVDGNKFIEILNQNSNSQILQMINKSYIAEGIYNVNLSHVKLILLTNEKEGRLIIGSGNLGFRGYSLNGEVFVIYEYKENEIANLDAFIKAKKFIEELIGRGFIVGEKVKENINQLFNSSIWFYKVNEFLSTEKIIHNLDENIAYQIKEILKDQQVEELIIETPFYDKNCIALKKLINIFNPLKIELLLQDKYTSIEIDALKGIIKNFENKFFLRKIDSIDNKYIHAKLYLFKLRDYSLLVSGSPNLSNNAMFKTASDGNIEMANISIGERDGFDELFNWLNTIRVNLENFNLSFFSDKPVEFNSSGLILLSGSWEKNKLLLFFNGKFPKDNRVSLVIDNREFKAIVADIQDHFAILSITDQEIELLSKLPPSSVFITYKENEEKKSSNAIFLVDIKSVENFQNLSNIKEKLELFERFYLENTEILEILQSLLNNLIVDEETLHKISKGKPGIEDLEAEDEISMDYKDIDFDAIYKHPRYLQYLSKGSKDIVFTPETPLQIILNSILKYFDNVKGLKAILMGKKTDEENKNLVSEEEAEEYEKERREKSVSEQKRLRRFLENFIKRLLKGFKSKNFIERVDSEVIIKNYMIINHLLLRVFDEDLDDKSFIADALLNLWDFFWGNKNSLGYYNNLEEEIRSEALNFLEKNNLELHIMVSIYKISNYLEVEKEKNIKIRDFLRHILNLKVLALSKEKLNDIFNYIGRFTLDGLGDQLNIIGTLKVIVNFETEKNFLKTLRDYFNSLIKNCFFEYDLVFRKSISKNYNAKCLKLITNFPIKFKEALDILSEWTRFEVLDYYRIHDVKHECLIFYDSFDGTGKYFKMDKEGNLEYMKEFLNIKGYEELWELEFKKIEDIVVEKI